jgi:hypothetical protein
MNRIYQGKATDVEIRVPFPSKEWLVEIANPHILSGSNGERAEISNPKLQAPEKSRNRNTKNQAPNTKEIPSSKLQTTDRASSLEFGDWSFSGVWSLEFGALIRPAHPLRLDSRRPSDGRGIKGEGQREGGED